MSNNRRFCHDLFNKDREECQAAILKPQEKDQQDMMKMLTAVIFWVVKLMQFIFIYTFLSPPHFPQNKYCFHNLKSTKWIYLSLSLLCADTLLASPKLCGRALKASPLYFGTLDSFSVHPSQQIPAPTTQMSPPLYQALSSPPTQAVLNTSE